MRIAVVLVNYNGLEDTIACLESLKCIEDDRFETIVVDNASSGDQANEIASRAPWATVIASDDNTGWSGGNNIGIRYALRMDIETGARIVQSRKIDDRSVDAVFLLNNDTEVNPTIITKLREGFEKGFAIVGPIINEFHDREIIQTEGVCFNSVKDNSPTTGFFRYVGVDRHVPDGITEVDIVNGCAVAIRREVFEKIGLIDDRFFLICEESDFCLRAQAAGFRAGVIHQSLVYHKHSVSFQRTGKPLQRYYGVRNLWLLINRHSGVRGRRGLWASRLGYLRYAYHVYAHETELRNWAGATAVAIGVSDALRGRLGKQPIEPSLLSKLLDCLAKSIWKCRGGRFVSAPGELA